MIRKFYQFLCLIMVLVMLVGIFAGGRSLMTSLQGTVPTIPHTITTTPANTTLPATTAPIPTQPDSPDPLPAPSFAPQPRLSKLLPLLFTPDHSYQEPVPTIPEVEIPKLNAKNAFVYDLRTGTFWYCSGDTSKAIYPASTTKLFTTYVALQYLQLEQTVKVGSELSYVESDASKVGFLKGDVVSVEALAYGALLPSGCDASYILAAAAGRVILNNSKASAKTAIAAFMDECNRWAAELGMENTNFVTADGYHHKQHRISMQAFAIIAGLFAEDNDLSRMAATASVTITYKNSQGKTCSKTLQNTNLSLQSDSKKFYHPQAVGLKTGYTDSAGYCLLNLYQVEDGYLVVGVFGCSSSAKRFQDANLLFETFAPYC